MSKGLILFIMSLNKTIELFILGASLLIIEVFFIFAMITKNWLFALISLFCGFSVSAYFSITYA